MMRLHIFSRIQHLALVIGLAILATAGAAHAQRKPPTPAAPPPRRGNLPKIQKTAPVVVTNKLSVKVRVRVASVLLDDAGQPIIKTPKMFFGTFPPGGSKMLKHREGKGYVTTRACLVRYTFATKDWISPRGWTLIYKPGVNSPKTMNITIDKDLVKSASGRDRGGFEDAPVKIDNLSGRTISIVVTGYLDGKRREHKLRGGKIHTLRPGTSLSGASIRKGGLEAKAILFVIKGDWSNEGRVLYAGRDRYDLMNRKCNPIISAHHLPGARTKVPDKNYRFLQKSKWAFTDTSVIKTFQFSKRNASKPSSSTPQNRSVKKGLVTFALIAAGAAFLSYGGDSAGNTPQPAATLGVGTKVKNPGWLVMWTGTIVGRNGNSYHIRIDSNFFPERRRYIVNKTYAFVAGEFK